ncbi:MAG: hypothetical protein N4A40_12600 [Tissierellales bacterium]|jgi:hypothetical protein|nr:hypothetical protein [Tissierellales bacterium]
MFTFKKIINRFKTLKTVYKSIFNNQGFITLEFIIIITLLACFIGFISEKSGSTSGEMIDIVPYIIPMLFF